MLFLSLLLLFIRHSIPSIQAMPHMHIVIRAVNERFYTTHIHCYISSNINIYTNGHFITINGLRKCSATKKRCDYFNQIQKLIETH